MPATAMIVSSRLHALAVLMLFAGAALIYGRVGGFGYSGIDDQGYVVYSQAVRAGLTLEGVRWAFTEIHMSNWHPLTWISHMIDVSLFGLEPGPQHLVNVFVHALNSVLAYVLAIKVLRHWFAAVVVAWLFMAHPLHVESVAWIAERKDLLCGFFFLFALLAYLRYAARPGPARYLGVTLAFVLALLSKPMAVTLPVLLLLLDYWPLARFAGREYRVAGRRVPALVWLVAEKIPWFALSLASGIVTLLAQTAAMAPVDDVPLSYRLMNVVLSWGVYLRDMLLPTRLAVLYPLTPIDVLGDFLPALLAVTLICVFALRWRTRYPWLLVGWLWFVVMLLPVIGLVQVGSQSHADRYMYLPSIGPLLALGAAIALLGEKHSRSALFGIVPAMGFYGVLAWVQVGYWSGPFMLFTRVTDVVGENLQSHISLSVYLLNEGRLEEAEAHALRAMELGASTAIAYANLGSIRLMNKDFTGAEQMFRLALERAPRDGQIMNNLGISLEEQGKLEEARRLFEAALQVEPNLYKVRNNLKRVGG